MLCIRTPGLIMFQCVGMGWVNTSDSLFEGSVTHLKAVRARFCPLCPFQTVSKQNLREIGRGRKKAVQHKTKKRSATTLICLICVLTV